MPELTPLDDNRQEHFLNGEDLEPITRREHFYAGRESELPAGHQEPETREEWFIKKYRGGGGGDITVESLSVTSNGTYTAPSGKAYSPVNVNVPLPQNAYLLKSVTTPTPIASFTDGEEMVMPTLKVAIEPQQDLHGYDAPWVGGAGKNKLVNAIDTYDISQATYHAYNVSPTISANTTVTLSVDCDLVSTKRLMVYTSSGDLIKVGDNGSKIITFNSTSDLSSFRLYIGNYDETVTHIVKAQLEIGSSATSYAPYSNICPIIGWDECNVSVVGKNLLNESALSNNKLIDGNGNLNDSSVTKCTEFYIKIKGLDTITVSYDYESLAYFNNRYYAFYDANKNFLLSNNYAPTNKVNQISIPNNAVYIRISFDMNVTNIMIEHGSTATTYEPYNGHTYTIDLDGTRYGGTLDVVNGVLTVDRIGVDMATLNWTNSSSNHRSYCYDIKNLIKIPSSQSAKSGCIAEKYFEIPFTGSLIDGEFAVAPNGDMIFYYDGVNPPSGKLVYPLATPLTIQLTPTQVKSLLGSNNVRADTGDITDVEYFSKEV